MKACRRGRGALLPALPRPAVDLRTTGGALPTYDCAHTGISWVHEALARGDRILMTHREAGFAAWRQIAPAVEVYAVRRG